VGRKRTKDFDLPPKLYRKGRRFYYVTPDRRWLPLGLDRARALRAWADYEAQITQPTMQAMVERYCAECMATNAKSTRKQYEAFARVVTAEWGSMPADQLTVYGILQYRNRRDLSPAWINGVLSLLRVAFDEALGWGWATQNPAKAAPFRTTQPRERYLSDIEFRTIRAASPEWLATAMDLSYLTALRPSDVVNLRWEDVGETINLRMRKTKSRMAFVITEELQEVLDRAKSGRVIGLYVIANEKGRPISMRRLQSTWQRVCESAKIKDAQYRDIRAKAASDADFDGVDATALLGHHNKSTTEVYLRRKKARLVEPMRKKL
jgi:integrase